MKESFMKGLVLALATLALANLASLPLLAEDSVTEGKLANQSSYQQYIAININTATVDELVELKGIGATKAQAIIDHRERHGQFKQMEDLLAVKGIGEKVLSQNKHLIKL
jgi:competence protein ComEA